MQKQDLLITLFLLFGIIANASSQDIRGVCGTPTYTPEQLRKIQKLKNQPIPNLRAEENVKIKFHIVTKSDGTYNFDELKVLDAMCYINEFYGEELGFQFHLSEDGSGEYFNYIASDDIYDNPSTSKARNRFVAEKDGNAINIFCAPTTGPGGGGSVTLAYYTPAGDYIVSRFADVSYVSTLSHEIGHFFNLPHPHNGWDNNPWDRGVHGDTVTRTVAENGVIVELVDGSNCSTAGDGFCDTPPDYNFGLTNGNACTFSRDVWDKNGDKIDPMEENVMAYFLRCNNFILTDEQVAVVANSRSSSFRNYLDNSLQATDPIGNYAIAFNGFENEQELNYKNSFIDWEDIPNAEKYFVRADISPVFTSSFKKFMLVDKSEVTFDEPNFLDQLIYFQIMPVNKSSFCDVGWSEIYKYLAIEISSVSENTGTIEQTIYPNPSRGTSVYVHTTVRESLSAEYSILSLVGDELLEFNRPLQSGENTFELQIGDLPAGVYYLKSTMDGASHVEKIVIQ